MSYFRYVCLRIVVSNTYCVVFLFCFSSSYVPNVASSLECPFWIAPSVFSNIYLLKLLFNYVDCYNLQGYLHALGMKRTAEVKRDARIGEAEAQRDAGIKVKFSFKQDFVSFIFFFRCTQYISSITGYSSLLVYVVVFFG